MLEKSDRNLLPFMVVFHGEIHPMGPSNLSKITKQIQVVQVWCTLKFKICISFIQTARISRISRLSNMHSWTKGTRDLSFKVHKSCFWKKNIKKKQKFHEVSPSMGDWVALPLKTCISFVVLVVPFQKHFLEKVHNFDRRVVVNPFRTNQILVSQYCHGNLRYPPKATPPKK